MNILQVIFECDYCVNLSWHLYIYAQSILYRIIWMISCVILGSSIQSYSFASWMKRVKYLIVHRGCSFMLFHRTFLYFESKLKLFVTVFIRKKESSLIVCIGQSVNYLNKAVEISTDPWMNFWNVFDWSHSGCNAIQLLMNKALVNEWSPRPVDPFLK